MTTRHMRGAAPQTTAAPPDARGRAKLLGEASTRLVHCIELLYPPGLELEPHVHSDPAISVCFSGRVEEVISGIGFSLESSSVYTRPPGVRHTNRFGEDHLRALVIELRPACLEQYPEAAGLVRQPAVFHGASILATATGLSRELRRAKGASLASSIDALALQLVSQLLRKGEAVSVSPTTLWVGEIVRHLKVTFHEHHSVHELAERFRLNPSYLGRVFKREMQVSVMEYLRKLRVEHAAQLLSSTSMPLCEIADACAFADQAHFTRVFKSVVGTTPRAYRRMSAQARQGSAQ